MTINGLGNTNLSYPKLDRDSTNSRLALQIPQPFCGPTIPLRTLTNCMQVLPAHSTYPYLQRYFSLATNANQPAASTLPYDMTHYNSYSNNQFAASPLKPKLFIDYSRQPTHCFNTSIRYDSLQLLL